MSEKPAFRSPAFTLPNPFGDLLGIQIRDLQPGTSTLYLDVHQDLMNPSQTLHGGAAYALADSGMALALYQSLPTDKNCATLEITMHYFRQVRGGTLTAESRILHQSRNYATLECILRIDDDTTVAQATGTFAIIDLQSMPSP